MSKTSSSRRTIVTRSLALAAVLPAAARAADSAANGAATAPAFRVAFQVSDADPAKWSLTLNNIRNAQAELGAGHTAIELVAYGPGIGMLLAGCDLAGRVSEAARSGVAVLACENTMRGQKLKPEQMNPDVRYVPSGVAHLIRRQTEGYAYIRS